MNRLSVRLTLAIGLTTLLAVGLVAVIANRAAGSEFRRYLTGNDPWLTEELPAALEAYYDRAGSWDGLAGQFPAVRGGQGRGRRQGMGQGGAILLVADEKGLIIYDSSGQRQGSSLSRAQRNRAIELASQGQVVGYLAILHGQAQLAAPEQAVLDRINEALMLAALLALLLSVVLGTLLARTLTAPLGRLANAAGAIAGGDLAQRVPEQGSVETRTVARSFNHMAAELARAEELRRNLVADVAHELRTPLTVIQGNLQAILDGVYPLERNEIVTIYDETRLLSRLVADLRELAQAEAGQLKLELRPIGIASVLDWTAASFEAAAEAKQISLDVVAAPALPLVQADPDRLAQVLRNLVSNALRHGGNGGHVTIQAGLAGDGRSQRKTPSFVLVTVADDGPGIAPADLPLIFNRFWRSDPARSRDQGGSGLGLAIARHLIEAMGGQIGVESQAGKGTTFWFTLPVAGS